MPDLANKTHHELRCGMMLSEVLNNFHVKIHKLFEKTEHTLGIALHVPKASCKLFIILQNFPFFIRVELCLKIY